MLFNSIDFLIFFPVVLVIYFAIPKKYSYIWLLIASYYFYMCWNPIYISLIVISTLVTYFCGIILGKVAEKLEDATQKKSIKKKIVLILGLLINLGILGYFKYSNFLINNWNVIANKLHINAVSPISIVLPVGISFYTFQAIGYMIDVYKGTVQPEKNILKYALFVSFFPQLVAGPIERSDRFLKQIQKPIIEKKWDYDRITSGLTIMLWGYFQKVVIADRLAVLVDYVFENFEQLGMVGLGTGAIAFAFQIYCDFAGYTWIAIGAAKVLGFTLMENFNTPYFASSVVDFWKRWHISMTSWFTDYVYIPLGGSRCSKWKHYRNIMVTFLVSGLWHGANWTYVCWGAIHGLYQIAEKEITPIIRKLNQRLQTKTDSFGYKFSKILVTFLLVDFAWIFFRADSIHQAIHYIYRMFHFRDYWALVDQSVLNLGLDGLELNIIVVALMLLFAVDFVKYRQKMNIDQWLTKQWIVFRWIALIGMLFFVLVLGYYGPGFDSAQFIYFQF